MYETKLLPKPSADVKRRNGSRAGKTSFAAANTKRATSQAARRTAHISMQGGRRSIAISQRSRRDRFYWNLPGQLHHYNHSLNIVNTKAGDRNVDLPRRIKGDNQRFLIKRSRNSLVVLERLSAKRSSVHQGARPDLLSASYKLPYLHAEAPH